MPTAVVNPALGSLNGIQVTKLKIDDQIINLTLSEVQQVTVANVEGQHEAAVITTQLTKTQITEFVDKIVSFTYGPRTNSNVFYGYVVTINPNRDYQVDTIVDITCMGVTWPMQNGTPKFVRNISGPDMFAAIVTGGFRQDVSTGYNLGAQVDRHPYTWPVLAQSDESDWEFLLTLAHRTGYAVYNYRGVVRLVRPLRILNETPVFASFIKGDEVLDPTRTLLEWEASTQSLNLRQNVKPSFGFFDGDTASTTQTGLNPWFTPEFPPEFPLPVGHLRVGHSNKDLDKVSPTRTSKSNILSPYRMRTDTPIKDRQMGDVYSTAWSDRIDFWNNQATARINGNARIVPGVNISVQVSGVPNGRNEYDGVWMVRGVRHSMTHNSFQTYLDLARDTTKMSVNTNDQWFWDVPLGAPQVLLDPVTGRWKSSWGAQPVYIGTTPGDFILS